MEGAGGWLGDDDDAQVSPLLPLQILTAAPEDCLCSGEL